MLDFLQREADPDTGQRMRKVRSFVLREGRLTRGQDKALERLWPVYGLERSDGVVDAVSIFGRRVPLVLEIGYGMGQSLVTMAEHEPDKDFIGIEVHRPGVGSLLMGIEERGLSNLCTYCDDGVEILEDCIPDASLHRLQLYFPDPWPKKKHHKRRIVQPGFLDLAHRKMEAGGVLHLATDWADYAGHMLDVLDQVQGWTNRAGAGQCARRPEWRPATRFETRGEHKGHEVHDIILEKTNS
jgi:tRNA (guanine-N7-)-methyltransferase